MSDLIERLRGWEDYEPAKMFGGEILKDIREAAAEIERLRFVVKTLRFEAESGFCSGADCTDKADAWDAVIKAREEEREKCARIAEFFNDGAHIAHDMEHGIFPKRSATNDAIADKIRAVSRS